MYPTDLRKGDLVREHTQAVKRYAWAVQELRRQVLNHEDTRKFRRDVVDPAQIECQALLDQWLLLYDPIRK